MLQDSCIMSLLKPAAFVTIVSGCPDIPPPGGAWITRDCDIMEIGCQSGAKAWSLEYQDNQWVGAIGQCGDDSGLQPCLFKYYQCFSLSSRFIIPKAPLCMILIFSVHDIDICASKHIVYLNFPYFLIVCFVS